MALMLYLFSINFIESTLLYYTQRFDKVWYGEGA